MPRRGDFRAAGGGGRRRRERAREIHMGGERGRKERERARARERKKEREERDIYAYLRSHSRECLTPGTRGLGRTGAKKIYHRRCIIHIHLELGECGKKYAVWVWARRGTAQRAQRTHRSPMAGTRQAEHALISARHTVRQHSRSDGLVFAARVRGGGLTGGRGDSRAWCAFWLAPRSFELATDPVAVCLPAP